MNVFKKNGGFTLVELIVVIAILAILAGVAVPVYSGYIEKANEANDLQLLSAINTAFSAACLEEQISVADLSSATIAVNQEDKTVGNVTSIHVKKDSMARAAGASVVALSNSRVNGVNKAFQLYIGENANMAFKYYDSLAFNPETGAFDGVDLDTAGGKIYEAFMAIMANVGDEISAVNGSTFGTIGSAGLMDKVTTVTGLAAGLAAESDEFAASLMSEANMNAMAVALGFKDASDPKFADKMGQMVADRVAATGATGPNAQDDAMFEILANFAVMETAKNTGSVNLGTMADDLSNGYIQKVKDLLNPSSSVEMQQQGMADAAMVYAMYTAYANQLSDDSQYKSAAMNGTGDITSFIAAVGDPTSDLCKDFQKYLGTSQAATDAEGYMGALGIINASNTKGNEVAVEQLLTNGYNDPALLASLQAMLGR